MKMKLVTKAKSIRSIETSPLTFSEQVQACCTIAREKLEAGDYDAGCAALRSWWKIGEWPRQQGLSQRAAAELLLTAGTLSDAVARTRQVAGGQRLAEALLNGAIALFEHLGDEARAAEGRIELGSCYYHQGLFDLAHATLGSSLSALSDNDRELNAVALIRLAIIERHSGRLGEALNLLNEAAPLSDEDRMRRHEDAVHEIGIGREPIEDGAAPRDLVAYPRADALAARCSCRRSS